MLRSPVRIKPLRFKYSILNDDNLQCHITIAPPNLSARATRSNTKRKYIMMMKMPISRNRIAANINWCEQNIIFPTDFNDNVCKRRRRKKWKCVIRMFAKCGISESLWFSEHTIFVKMLVFIMRRHSMRIPCCSWSKNQQEAEELGRCNCYVTL